MMNTREILEPFAKAQIDIDRPKSAHNPEGWVWGQPLVGDGAIARRDDFKAARIAYEAECLIAERQKEFEEDLSALWNLIVLMAKASIIATVVYLILK